jgi:hypothetical protein
MRGGSICENAHRFGNHLKPFTDFVDPKTMATVTDYTPPRAIAYSQTGYFYFYMALACMAVAFLGFAPTYWLPLASRSFQATPVIHFHGLLFFAWTLYFAFQAWLATSGNSPAPHGRDDRRVVRHRHDDFRFPGRGRHHEAVGCGRAHQ